MSSIQSHDQTSLNGSCDYLVLHLSILPLHTYYQRALPNKLVSGNGALLSGSGKHAPEDAWIHLYRAWHKEKKIEAEFFAKICCTKMECVHLDSFEIFTNEFCVQARYYYMYY